ncbi:CHASE domain-containing protein [Stutzerimonas azotifigens]|uniref:histidine kinase n=1 Tax=Stutzerimonas azotifigens TaxID=291995 RepID=A0ABR5Z0G3_9GAMM|nr:CHASE domain-containing protein [Stutzerimonas azotifigens]MBA1273702.1 PAS domain-containing protein [Stutzerimonas azotifigens]
MADNPIERHGLPRGSGPQPVPEPRGLKRLLHRRNALAWLVLAFTLLVQMIILQNLRGNESRAAQEQFQMLANKVTEAIEQRLVNHEQILLGAAGLFDASGEVDRDQWHRYVERLQLTTRYPGIQGVGFGKVVRQQERAAHVQSMRAEGFPDYDIHPPGERPLYISVIYLEPFIDRNTVALGYDMFSEPVRQRALLRAAELGLASVTDKVTLRQETPDSTQAGILLYVPVYRPGMPLALPMQRMDALIGVVYSPYRVSDLMRGILGPADPKLNLTIYSGDSEEPDDLIFATNRTGKHNPRYSSLQHIRLYGQIWTLRLDSQPEFENAFHANEALLVILCIGLSALLFLLTSSLTVRRSRAEALARQMTEQIRQNERELRLSEERLALALKGSNDGLWDLNLQTGTFFASPRSMQMLGYHPGELESDMGLWERMMVADDLGVEKERLSQTLQSQREHFTSELRLQHRNGQVVPVLVRGYVQRDSEGKPQRVSGTIMDLTEHKRVEQLKNEFVSTVSHELRTPLTSIAGALGLINGGVLGAIPAPMQQLLEIAHRNSLRLKHLINDLLDMEKIAAGKMSFNRREYPLRDLLEEALASNQSFAAQHGVRCTLETDTSAARVWVDGLRLQQVLANFLSNAIKFSPQGGEVHLKSSVNEGLVRISVIDQGPGIPDSFRQRIFQKFAQADSSDSREKGGTGLGLAISKELVERMGGCLGFESVVGQGTTFWCELPVLDDPAQEHGSDKPRLLVIEDEPDTGRLLHMMLRNAGYGVDRVESLHQAREKLAEAQYLAVTLDLHLPDGNGHQLIDEMREHSATRDLPIIVISAANSLDQQQSQPGIIWLHKPISDAQLLAAVERARQSTAPSP